MKHLLVARSLPTEELSEIQEALSNGSGETIYQQGDQTIVHFQAAGRDLISKSYRLTSIKQKLAALFRRSRARRSFRAGELLVSAGIPTPRPVLLMETGSLLPSSSSLVTDYCGFPSLLHQIHEGHPIPPSVPQNILRLLHQLASIHCSHGDFHARNLLISPEGSVQLIDLDGVRQHHRNSETIRHSIKDRDRVLRSLEPLPEHHATFAQIIGSPGEPLPALSS